MPRKASPDQTSLDFDGFEESEPSAESEPESDGPRRGRPRIWASEAERKRAYRERKAADLAEPERLRAELRVERRRLASKNQQLARKDAQLAQIRADLAAERERQVTLESTIKHLEGRVESWRSDAASLRKRLDEALSRERRDRQTSDRTRRPSDLRLPRFDVPPDRPR